MIFLLFFRNVTNCQSDQLSLNLAWQSDPELITMKSEYWPWWHNTASEKRVSMVLWTVCRQFDRSQLSQSINCDLDSCRKVSCNMNQCSNSFSRIAVGAFLCSDTIGADGVMSSFHAPVRLSDRSSLCPSIPNDVTALLNLDQTSAYWSYAFYQQAGWTVKWPCIVSFFIVWNLNLPWRRSARSDKCCRDPSMLELIDTWFFDTWVWSLPWHWHILSIPLTTGRGTGAETCGLDDVFPPDDLCSRPETLC